MNQDLNQSLTVFMSGQKKSQKVFADKLGKRGKRTNLIAARKKGSKNLISPMIVTGSVKADVFEEWLSIWLLPELKETSILIMDNASIHRKKVIQEIVDTSGHHVLFLPKYSPDLNDIEPDFSALKRARMYAPSDQTIDEIIREYCAR